MSIGALPRELGRYDLFDAIASGGMATVHFGRMRGAVGFQRVVAIKRLHPHYAHDSRFVEMFLDEARLASRLKHPNVIQTLDVVADGDDVMLVMEFVLGESLEALMPRSDGRVIPLPVASAIVCNVLEGLHGAHDATSDTGSPLGIVHRDVSPSNVLVGDDGIARVFDFGIAKAAINTQETRDGVVKGKVTYMAPEQVKGSVDRRADLYAAGVILWELVTGMRRFAGERNDSLFLRLATNDLPPLARASEMRIDVPDALDEVLAIATSHDPTQRYATAREMAMAIESVVRPAPAREVAEWLSSTAGNRIAVLSEAMKRIEAGPLMQPSQSISIRMPPSTLTAAGVSSSVPPSAAIGATASGLVSPPPKRSFTMPAALLAFTAVLLLVGLRALAARGYHETRGVVDANAGPRPVPEAIPISTVTRTEAPATATTTAAPEPAPLVTATAAPLARVPTWQPPAHTATAVAPSPPPAPEPRAKPSCDNPFVVGTDGIRQVKPECM